MVHNAAFGAAGINAVYVPFRVPRDTLAQFMEDAPRLGIKGLSVTIPHKEAIAQQLTKVDPAVKRHRRGQHGGVRRPRWSATTPTTTRRWTAWNMRWATSVPTPSPLEGQARPGAGRRRRGPADRLRAAQRGAQAMIASRTPARAERLADAFDGKAVDWEARHRGNVDMLVNCTPVGMHPNVDETPLHKHT